MKIALVIERFLPEAGGAEKSTAQIARLLAERGHDVTVLTTWGDGDESGVLVRTMCQRPRRIDAVRLRAFRRWVQQQRGDGSFDVSLSVTTAVAADVVQPRSGTLRETQLRNVAMRRSTIGRLKKRLSQLMSPKQRLLVLFERQTMRDPSVKMLLAVSDYVKWQLQSHYAIDTERITVLANGSVMPQVDDKQRAAWRRQVRGVFGIEADVPVFLFAAHNPVLKGVEPLLQAVKVLKDRGVWVTLLLVGQITYKQHAMAAGLGVRDQVRIVGATRCMAELYCAADVTVLPTFYDPASKVVIESLMMGCPAISTRYNGASDWLTGHNHSINGDTQPAGCVVDEPHDVAGLADAMQRLLDDDFRRRCGEAAGRHRDALSMSRHVDRLEQVLADVMKTI